jgi:hypothetical protein
MAPILVMAAVVSVVAGINLLAADIIIRGSR